MKEALFRLDEFCRANGIDYMVTGTMALSLLGVPSRFEPQDIDIKVFNLSQAQRDTLSTIQFSSGLEKGYKDSELFTIPANDKKVNIFVDEKHYCYVVMCFTDEECNKQRLIKVQSMQPALDDKMRLNRVKDRLYLLDLVYMLMSCQSARNSSDKNK